MPGSGLGRETRPSGGADSARCNLRRGLQAPARKQRQHDLRTTDYSHRSLPSRRTKRRRSSVRVGGAMGAGGRVHPTHRVCPGLSRPPLRRHHPDNRQVDQEDDRRLRQGGVTP
ncbi:uncharacterized protein LOC125047872 [Penaeus chinensis]|uniref:uncharacterized protein LOC125047872 n=1 Tax=Penaeus chinensis TaxID=139456 RepID=UPI001FB6F06B|nr:uncharacterized protein LOC125047872 [Penaeus chinensis]